MRKHVYSGGPVFKWLKVVFMLNGLVLECHSKSQLLDHFKSNQMFPFLVPVHWFGFGMVPTISELLQIRTLKHSVFKCIQYLGPHCKYISQLKHSES